MNQAFTNHTCKATLDNLNKAYEHCGRFKKAGTKVRSQFIHLDLLLHHPYFLSDDCIDDIMSAYDSVMTLIEKKLPYAFLSFLITDTSPRMERAYLQNKRNLEKTDTPYNENFLLNKNLEELLQRVPIGQGYNEEISINGIKGAVDQIIENRIFSNRVRWLLLVSLKSNFLQAQDNWKQKKISEINQKLTHHETILMTSLFDSDVIKEISSYKIEKRLFYKECLLISLAYSKACLLPDFKITLCKNVFPILTKELLVETQKILITDHNLQFDIPKIKKFLRGTLETDTNKAFVFLNSQKI